MKELGILYFHIYEKLKLKTFPDGSITRKEIFHCLGKNYYISKEIKEIILWEMEIAGLIKRKMKGKFEICPIYNIGKVMEKKIMNVKRFL